MIQFKLIIKYIIINLIKLMDKDKSKSTKSTTDTDLGSNAEYEIPISDNFKLNAKRKLGSGAFGDIYHGIFYNNCV